MQKKEEKKITKFPSSLGGIVESTAIGLVDWETKLFGSVCQTRIETEDKLEVTDETVFKIEIVLKRYFFK